MTVSKPNFSIIIPTYNYAHTLPRAVESVLVQLTTEHELIIVDDGSTDETKQVLICLQKKHPEQFRIIHKENGGVSTARNRGISESCGRFLIFLDADDELTPDALQLFQEHLNAQPETRVIIGGHWACSDNGKKRLHSGEDLPSDSVTRLRYYLLDKRVSISHGACAMHRDVFKLGNYPEAFRSAEDIPVFAQAIANFPCGSIKQPLAVIHKHNDSLRHQFTYAKTGGLALVDEVFSPQRLSKKFQIIKQDYYIKRCLSLFRSATIAGDRDAAKTYYVMALKKNWRIIFLGSYTRKALRLWI